MSCRFRAVRTATHLPKKKVEKEMTMTMTKEDRAWMWHITPINQSHMFAHQQGGKKKSDDND